MQGYVVFFCFCLGMPAVLCLELYKNRGRLYGYAADVDVDQLGSFVGGEGGVMLRGECGTKLLMVPPLQGKALTEGQPYTLTGIERSDDGDDSTARYMFTDGVVLVRMPDEDKAVEASLLAYGWVACNYDPIAWWYVWSTHSGTALLISARFSPEILFPLLVQV